MRALPILPLLTLALLPAVEASILVYDRGLPTQGVNSLVPGERSNTALQFGQGTADIRVLGDDFLLPETTPPAGYYVLDRIRFWVVTNGEPVGSSTPVDFLGDFFSDLQVHLWRPESTSPARSFSAGLSSGTNATSNPAVTVTPTTYTVPGQPNYLGGGGTTQRRIFEIEVAGLDLGANVNEPIRFASIATPRVGTLYFIHATIGSLVGGSSSDFDTLLRLFDTGTLAEVAGSPLSAPDNADLNVQVWAATVPEPGAAAALAGVVAGLALIGARARRRAAAPRPE